MPDSNDDMVDIDSASTSKHSKRDQKKNRKPYTITKPRESWTDEEHDLFLEALQLFEREWKQIEAHIKTKTVIQIRSHAQKYFQKMQKTGKQDCIPPPRPKRRSKKPYPKISRDRKVKNPDFRMPHSAGPNQDYISTAYPFGSPTSSIVNQIPPRPTMQTASVVNSLQWALWERQQLAELQQEQLSQAQYYLQQAIAAHTVEDKQADSNDVSKSPNFPKVYSFLGSLFDPSTSGHVEQLRCMDDMDRQVVQLLMQNLASNLGKHHTIANDFHGPQEASNKELYMSMSHDHMNKFLIQPSSRPGAAPMESTISKSGLDGGANHGNNFYPGASNSNMM
uniref:Uncharacterized protein n=1 Tax=Spongospora subterranea TaxID=70186 RepID=A0A0H5RBX2_9EUKA|eukprot:CRZ11102.1 hypothetical protein [Spongospora subterranea]